MRAVNLIPAEERRGAGGIAGRTGGVVYVLLGTLVALVLLGVIYAVAVHDVAARKTTLAQVTNQVNQVGAEVAAFQPYIAFATLSQQRIENVASLSEQRFDWPLAMEQIALSLPSNVTLVSLNGAASGGGSSGATGASGTAGSATTAAAAGPVGSTVVNAPTIALSGCAHGSDSVGQNTVATTLARFRKLTDVSSVTLSGYTAGGCGAGTATGVAFQMSIAYNNAYAIPPVRVTAATNSTVGG
jgi:Tfp pilus assembly protein PilN